MLAAMARTALPEVQAPWWRVHMMAWVVPVSAAAAALIVWTALPTTRSALDAPERTAQVAQARPAEPQASSAPAAAEAPREKELVGQTKKSNAARDSVSALTAEGARQQRSEFRRMDAAERKGAESELAKRDAAPAKPRADAVADSRARALTDRPLVTPPLPQQPVALPPPVAPPPSTAAAAPPPPPAPAQAPVSPAPPPAAAAPAAAAAPSPPAAPAPAAPARQVEAASERAALGARA